MSRIGRQKGAVIITVAFTLLFLLAFMAIALDFGHLFIVKTELQTATDSCALAAAQELDGASDALTRATNAGKTAGNRNKVNFQGGSAGIGDYPDDISFSDSLVGTYSNTFTPVANARYAMCKRTKSGMRPWLLQAMGAFTGNAAYGDEQKVFALAVATRASAQSTCPVPIGLIPKPGGTKSNNYGFQAGEWATVFGSSSGGPGQMGWYDLTNSGSSSAANVEAQLIESNCGTKVGDSLGAQVTGAMTKLDAVWNYRFGIYKNNDPGPSVNHPDFSGYAYTSTNWKNTVPQNAYAGTAAIGSHSSAKNFKTKRLEFASYDDTGTSIQKGDQITGLKTNSFKSLATPGASISCPDAAHEHQCYGYNRRIVVVPIINTSATVQDFVCMLMLQPMSGPTADVQMEFLGNAGAPDSPCTTNGLAGGAAGPLVPVLVQ
jgi:hypothetical protein